MLSWMELNWNIGQNQIFYISTKHDTIHITQHKEYNMSNTTSIRLGTSTQKWVSYRLNKNETFSGYIHTLIRDDMNNSIQGSLYRKINEVMYDIDVRLEEAYQEIADGLDKLEMDETKVEIVELNELKVDLLDAQNDILIGEMTDEDATDLLKDIKEI